MCGGVFIGVFIVVLWLYDQRDYIIFKWKSSKGPQIGICHNHHQMSRGISLEYYAQLCVDYNPHVITVINVMLTTASTFHPSTRGAAEPGGTFSFVKNLRINNLEMPLC